HAAASDGPLTNGETPAGSRYPYIQREVPLLDQAGAFVCEAYGLGDGPQAQGRYTDPGPIGFSASVRRSSPDEVALNNCDPTEVCGACSSTCYLGSGSDFDDGTGGGVPHAPTLAEELEDKVNPDDIVGLVASDTG